MSRLNYFLPYQNKLDHHEDNLTRAFLVTLRFSAIAQIQFYRLIQHQVLARRQEYDSVLLPEVEDLPWNEVWFDTQATDLRGRKASLLVSIVLTDATLRPTHTVHVTDRTARYDGLFAIGDEVLFVLENKPRDFGFWEGQMNPSSKDVDTETTIIIPIPVSIEWNQIVHIFKMVRTIPGVTEQERLMIDDFFEYVNQNFASLNPYRTLGECQNAPELLNRRIQRILTDITGDPEKVYYHRGWGHYILTGLESARKAALLLEEEPDKPADWSVALSYSAGDTMRQARQLYRNGSLASSLQKLQQDGWGLTCNFHLSFMSSNLIWISTPSNNLISYINFWANNNHKIHQYSKTELVSLLEDLVNQGILEISKSLAVELQTKIFDKGYQTLNICPSVYMQHYFSTAEAIELDKQGVFAREVRHQMDKVTQAIRL